MTDNEGSVKRLGVFYFIVGLFWSAQYIYSPYFSPHLVTLGFSGSLIGTIVGVYGFSQMVLRIPISIGGRYTGNHKPIIVAGLACVVIACVLPLLGDNWILFFMSRLLAGVASATWVSYSAYILESAGKLANQRMSYLLVAQHTGTCLSQVIATVVFGYTGIVALFTIGAIGAAVAIILIFFVPIKKIEFSESERETIKSGVWSDFGVAIRNKQVWFCALLLTLGNYMIFSSIYAFTGVYAQEELNVGDFRIGVIGIIFQASTVVVGTLIGRAAKRNLPERAMIVFGFLAFSCYLLLMLVVKSPNAFLLLQVLGGVSYPFASNLLFSNAGRELLPRQQIIGMGIFQSVYSLGMTFGPAISGIVFDATGGNYTITFVHLAVVGVIAAIWAFLKYKNSWEESERVKNGLLK